MEARAKAKQLGIENEKLISQNNQLRAVLQDTTGMVDPEKQQLLVTLQEQASLVRTLQSDIQDKSSAMQQERDEINALVSVPAADSSNAANSSLERSNGPICNSSKRDPATSCGARSGSRKPFE